ncbi:hypothetical protein V1478_000496 [Vespula squamosa]|uniref:Uncharacterized protein n=1 Tax=Vespula squamosa TaxID=30214 RepID=A0ABD2C5N0_VESSQ
MIECSTLFKYAIPQYGNEHYEEIDYPTTSGPDIEFALNDMSLMCDLSKDNCESAPRESDVRGFLRRKKKETE